MIIRKFIFQQKHFLNWQGEEQLVLDIEWKKPKHQSCILTEKKCPKKYDIAEVLFFNAYTYTSQSNTFPAQLILISCREGKSMQT